MRRLIWGMCISVPDVHTALPWHVATSHNRSPGGAGAASLSTAKYFLRAGGDHVIC
jgi:hypothetical protein